MATRFEAWQKAINASLYTPNEIRAKENEAPIPGGDTLLVNSTMVPIMHAGRTTPTGRPQ